MSRFAEFAKKADKFGSHFAQFSRNFVPLYFGCGIGYATGTSWQLLHKNNAGRTRLVKDLMGKQEMTEEEVEKAIKENNLQILVPLHHILFWPTALCGIPLK